jgi:hypothetical protein
MLPPSLRRPAGFRPSFAPSLPGGKATGAEQAKTRIGKVRAPGIRRAIS